MRVRACRGNYWRHVCYTVHSPFNAGGGSDKVRGEEVSTGFSWRRGIHETLSYRHETSTQLEKLDT